jgi:hypothetical protein
MFRTVFVSIIKRSRLHIQKEAYVKHILLPAASGNEVELFLIYDNFFDISLLLYVQS